MRCCVLALALLVLARPAAAAIELGKPIRGENVIAPGRSGFIKHRGPLQAQADPHVGDQAALVRTFTYKPMELGKK